MFELCGETRRQLPEINRRVPAAEPGNRRADKQLKTDQAAHGIAGDTEDERQGRCTPNHNGLPGFKLTL